ncbi:MAG: hypothetical protein ACM3OO_09245 [Planctomycetaceae bacterium]
MTERAQDRPAFYALSSGGWRDYWTLLHPPYTLWHLSYVAIGAALAPSLHPAYLGLAMLAFFLGVGIAAHALDELHGRPLRTRIPTRVLIGLAAAALVGALAVGLYGCSVVSWWGLVFIAIGAFVVPAYNLEWFGGRFHTEWWFAGMWGGFPALAGYFAQTGRIDPIAFAGFIACAAVALAQRRLSTPVRMLRRRARSVQGEIVMTDGTVERIDAASLRAAPEAALRVLWVGMVVLAAAMVAARWP